MKKLLSFIIVAGMFFCCSVLVFAATEPLGDGTEEAPYLISNADELLWFCEQVNGGETDIDAVLTQSIYLSGTWTPIGAQDKIYTGTFDGNGKTINDLYAVYDVDTTNREVGLFYYNSGIIKNVTVRGEVSSVTAAGICVYNNPAGQIINCVNYADISTNSLAGGICSNNRGAIIDCENYGTISGLSQYGRYGIGGISGFQRGQIVDCINYGKLFVPAVDGTRPGAAGGIVYGSDGGTISGCENRGEIQSAGEAGGIMVNLSNASVSKCINYGKISGGGTQDCMVAGVAGGAWDSTVRNCINYGVIDGGVANAITGGIVGYTNSPIVGCLNCGNVTAVNYVGGVFGKCDGDGKACASYSLENLVTVADEMYEQADLSCNIKEETLKRRQTAWRMNTGDGEYENSGVWAEGALFADEEKKAVFRAEISGKDLGIIYTNSKGVFEELKNSFVYINENNDLIDASTVVSDDVELLAKDYVITNVSFFGENGEKPYEIPLGKVYANVTVVAPKNGTEIQVILAEYENDMFSEADICKKKTQGTDTLTASVQVDGEDYWGDGSEFVTWNTDLKVFVWDSNMRPGCESVGYYD